MKMILYSLKVCLYQIRIISKNYKIYTIPVCLFIFMKSFLDPFREFLIASGEKATPFLFPIRNDQMWKNEMDYRTVFLYYFC